MGLLYPVLVGIPLVVLAMRPGDPIALAAVATLAVLVGALWGVAWPQLWNGLGLAFTVGLLVWLGRARPPQWRRPSRVLSVLAVLGCRQQ